MQLPDAARLYQVVEATWPPARIFENGPWTIRDGAGGGKRVSAATAHTSVDAGDLTQMEQAAAAMNQSPLVMIREGEEVLDRFLAENGYQIIDPVVLYACPIETLLTPAPDRLDGFALWPPLAIQEELWAEGGIGPARIDVMRRAPKPKTTVLGRCDSRAAGTAYVGLHQRIAMLHAMEVAPQLRRKGAACKMMRVAAHWAAKQGADIFSLVTTRENAPANGLYASLGMVSVGQYHYRINQTAKTGQA